MREGRQNHGNPIPVNFYTSFQVRLVSMKTREAYSSNSLRQLNKMLQVMFERDSIAAQNNVIEEGQYDLSIDKGARYSPSTSHEWPSIEAGTMTVMRVIFEQQAISGVDYQCHFCGAVNRLGVETIMHLLQLFQRRGSCSIDWWVCLSSGYWQQWNTWKSNMQTTISDLPYTYHYGEKPSARTTRFVAWLPQTKSFQFVWTSKVRHRKLIYIAWINPSVLTSTEQLFGVADGIEYRQYVP